jgi:hypothetical protein
MGRLSPSETATEFFFYPDLQSKALSSRKLRVHIKKGGDGIGQLTEYQGQTKNCIRADFVVMDMEFYYDGSVTCRSGYDLFQRPFRS